MFDGDYSQIKLLNVSRFLIATFPYIYRGQKELLDLKSVYI